MYTDGGSEISAAVVLVEGPEKIISFIRNIVKNALDIFQAKPVLVNGSAGILLINRATGQTDTICTLETDGEKITGLFMVRNPDKILV